MNLNRRDFLKNVAAVTAFGALGSFGMSIPGTSGKTAKHLKFGPRILLRDFRTVKNGEVVNFNIGTAAHAPGTLAVLKKHLGDAVRVTV